MSSLTGDAGRVEEGGRRALAPTANQISVREVLAKFDAEFAAMAHAVENGEFALWSVPVSRDRLLISAT